MYIAYAVVRHIDSKDSVLRFREFQMRQISSTGDIKDAETLFPGTRFNGTEWLYERSYADSEVKRGEYGFGRIPSDLEDTLLLLRLFKPGDIVFTRHSIREPNGNLSIQYPQRIAAEIVTKSFFSIGQVECESWDKFRVELTALGSWNSQWCSISRRFFLYGGAKEFNPEWNEVDRIVDYMVALESCLVPEQGYGIGQRIRKRAIALIGHQGKEAGATNRTLSEFYGVRSTLVHGSPLNDRHRKVLRGMPQFESLIRQILVAALRRIPADEDDRKYFLRGLFSVPVKSLFEEAIKILKEISTVIFRRSV